MIAPSPTTNPPALPAVLADQIGFLSAKAHMRFLERGNDALEPLGLTVKHFGILSVIASEGPIPQGHLGDLMRIDRTTMVAMVDDLERDGHVNRSRNPEDRRAYALVVTAGGRRLQQEAGEVICKAQDEVLSPLPVADREALTRILRTLLEA